VDKISVDQWIETHHHHRHLHHHWHNSPFWAIIFLRSFCQTCLFTLQLDHLVSLLWISGVQISTWRTRPLYCDIYIYIYIYIYIHTPIYQLLSNDHETNNETRAVATQRPAYYNRGIAFSCPVYAETAVIRREFSGDSSSEKSTRLVSDGHQTGS
jgi:hypothetical protein